MAASYTLTYERAYHEAIDQRCHSDCNNCPLINFINSYLFGKVGVKSRDKPKKVAALVHFYPVPEYQILVVSSSAYIYKGNGFIHTLNSGQGLNGLQHVGFYESGKDVKFLIIYILMLLLLGKSTSISSSSLLNFQHRYYKRFLKE